MARGSGPRASEPGARSAGGSEPVAGAYRSAGPALASAVSEWDTMGSSRAGTRERRGQAAPSAPPGTCQGQDVAETGPGPPRRGRLKPAIAVAAALTGPEPRDQGSIPAVANLEPSLQAPGVSGPWRRRDGSVETPAPEAGRPTVLSGPR